MRLFFRIWAPLIWMLWLLLGLTTAIVFGVAAAFRDDYQGATFWMVLVLVYMNVLDNERER